MKWGFDAMLAPMRNGVWILLAVPLLAVGGEARWLTADEWSRPRDGMRVLQLDPVARSVRELAQTTGAHLRLRYPGGEDGTLWVEELRAWLIALGVSGDRIDILGGSPREDAVELTIVEQP